MKRGRSELQRNFTFLRFLCKSLRENSKKKKSVKILKSASDSEIKTILEIVANFLSGNFPSKVQKQTVDKLRTHKRCIRDLLTPPSTNKARKKSINQRGGAVLTALLPPLIAALISSGIEKYV